MTTKTFVDYSDPVVDAAWLNDTNTVVYTTVPANTAAIAADVAALAAHLADTTDAHAASAITNTPAGNIAATTVQAALNELDTEKAAVAQTMYIGTTSVAINRASAAIALTGITSIDGNAATATLATTATTVSTTISSGTTGTTQTSGDNSTKIATTAYSDVRPVIGTAQNTTSGTAINFTGIPSWVRRITVMFNGISTNGTSSIQVQIGSGSYDTSGYNGTYWFSGGGGGTFTTGFGIKNAAASDIFYGHMLLTNMGGDLWISSGVVGYLTSGTSSQNGSSRQLAGTLDRLRLTTVNGTDVFDLGSVNILYE